MSLFHWLHHFLTLFSKVHEFVLVQNSVFSPRLACFVIFGLGTPLLNVFSKVHEFVQNSVFSPRWARFCYFCILPTTFLHFSPNCTSLYKTGCLARDQHVLLYLHWVKHVLAFFSKVHEFVLVQNSVFSPRSACFVIFGLGTPLLNVFSKVDEFVQNSVFNPRSARFVIFVLGATGFSFFQQSVRVCTKQCFHPEINT